MKWDKLAAIRLLVLVLVGFGSIVWGAFLFHIIAGLLCLGVSCLLLAYLTDTTQPATR